MSKKPTYDEGRREGFREGRKEGRKSGLTGTAVAVGTLLAVFATTTVISMADTNKKAEKCRNDIRNGGINNG